MRDVHKKNLEIRQIGRRIIVNFKNTATGTPYVWHSSNRTLRSKNNGRVVQTGVRMSNIFKKSTRRAIKGLISPKQVQPRSYKKSPTNSPNVRTRTQQGPTCWFHAIINGLLMSWKSRRMLESRIPLVNTNVGGRSLFSNSPANSCPSRRASGQMFWRYIEHRLSGKGKVSPRYTNKNVIKNLGLRRKYVPNIVSMIPRWSNTKRTYMRRFMSARSSVMGGTFSDLLNVYDKLFPGEVSMASENRPTTFIIEKGRKFDKYIMHAGRTYDLSHGYIEVMLPGSIAGHAMAGYVSRLGNYNLYDSGFGIHIKDFRWHMSAANQVLLQYLRENYRLPVTKVSKWAIYIRTDKINKS